MEQEFMAPITAPFYVIRNTWPEGVDPAFEPIAAIECEVIAVTSSEYVGNVVVRLAPCAANQQIEMFSRDEFTRDLQVGDKW